jgi:hypothetical protein
MPEHFKLKKPNFLIGLLFTPIFIFLSCKEGSHESESSDQNLTYLAPVDSVDFAYSSPSWKRNTSNYLENRYGQNLYLTSDKKFLYASINSDNELHAFNSKTNEHTYSKQICSGRIDAFKIDSSLMYLLYNNMFYVKDHQLKTIDSFVYTPPVINQKHSIDFSIENNSNLFKIKNYFVLLYYVVDEKPDDTEIYRNTEYLFYFFNRDTAFFANKQCQELSSSFQYFRYPVVASNDEYLYHTPRVMNCISKSSENKTLIHALIDTVKSNYLAIKPNDQYEISRLKKYRFSSDYNRDILLSNNCIYLIKEIPAKIYYKDNVRMYETVLELKKFDKQFNLVKSTYIKDHIYSYALIEGNKLLLFNFFKNKYFTYEI